jgi:hypothetical protein
VLLLCRLVATGAPRSSGALSVSSRPGHSAGLGLHR